MSLTKKDLQSIENIVHDSENRLDVRVQGVESKLDKKIQALEEKVQNVESKLGKKIQDTSTMLEEKVQNVESKLGKKIRNAEKRLDTKLSKKIINSENSLKEFVKSQLSSQFKIQKMVLDTQLRAINSKFDYFKKNTTKNSQEILTLKEHVDEIDERMQMHP